MLCSELLESSVAHVARRASAKDLAAIQTELVQMLGKHNAQISPDVHRLNLGQALYFKAVYELEHLRMQASNATFYPAFAYLADPGTHAVA